MVCTLNPFNRSVGSGVGLPPFAQPIQPTGAIGAGAVAMTDADATPSVFERLANHGTAASNARLAEGKAIRERYQQRRAAEAAASFPMRQENPVKLQLLHPLDHQSVPTKPSSRKGPIRTHQQREALHARLAKQETISSAGHHIKLPGSGDHESLFNRAKSPRRARQPPPQDRSPRWRSPIRSPEQQDALFNRLADQETIASAAHHMKIIDGLRESLFDIARSPGERAKSPVRTPEQQEALFERLAEQETISSAAHHIRLPGLHESALNRARSPVKAHPSEEHSLVYNRLYKQETASTKAHHHKDDERKTGRAKGLEKLKRCFSPKNQQRQSVAMNRLSKRDTAATKAHHRKKDARHVSIKMKLHVRTKEEKRGGKPYVNLDLPQEDVRKRINAYHKGKITAESLASDVITALFHMYFMRGKHWDVESATVDEVAPPVAKEGRKGEKISIFRAEKRAVWDWKDINSVASAKGVIKISRGDVHVDEYSYHVTG